MFDWKKLLPALVLMLGFGVVQAEDFIIPNEDVYDVTVGNDEYVRPQYMGREEALHFSRPYTEGQDDGRNLPVDVEGYYAPHIFDRETALHFARPYTEGQDDGRDISVLSDESHLGPRVSREQALEFSRPDLSN
ncbi:MAG: hypothetical protein LIP28_04205 [Deltaproteobacteria bacterium]|nr:hypothetical protein [Deltaproteobacteria bacterium]